MVLWWSRSPEPELPMAYMSTPSPSLKSWSENLLWSVEGASAGWSEPVQCANLRFLTLTPYNQALIRLRVFDSEGMWTVVAKFDHWKQNTFPAQFEVKKYGKDLWMFSHLFVFVAVVAVGAHVCLVFVIQVLPAFNVTLMPRKPFLSLYDSELAVEISARSTSYILYTSYFSLRLVPYSVGETCLSVRNHKH